MSLRIRLILMFSMLFLASMLLGLAFLVSNARQRVSEEVNSAAMLTWQLLDSALFDVRQRNEQSGEEGSDQGNESVERTRLLRRLQALDDVRHLEINLVGAGAPINLLQRAMEPARAPSWFVYLVRSTPVEYRIPLDAAGSVTILIRSNPADEIGEVWQETRNFIVVLVLVLLILIGLLYFTLGLWLAPVSAIVAGLEDAEHGDFSGRVSRASLPELRIIAEKLNQLTAVLRTSKEENDRLKHRALLIQEEERRHLARELHDEMGQSISAIKAMAFSIAERTRELDGMSAEGAGRIGVICNQVSGHVRRLMGRLRPALLDELGLVPALQAMIDEWNNTHSDTFCSFRVNGSFVALDPARQIGLYRIVQEALTNVAKHATAERVDVQLWRDAGYHLSIRDNGQGYDMTQVRPGMGLTGIRERCEALHGHCMLASTPGDGTRIMVRFAEEDVA